MSQDELAETQVPSPGYTGVNDEIAMESFEYDVYEYFGELEYGSDSYWDARIKHLADARAGDKRKSEDVESEAAVVKKRRKDAGLEARDNVVFVPFDARLAPLPPLVRGDGRFALLPDWKERFPDRVGESPGRKGKQMPADMRRAAEADAEEEEEQEDSLGGEDDQMELGSDEDEEDDDEEDDGATAGIDQDVIMHVLRQKLADSGLGDVDESVFKDAIAQMMSGEGNGEDALGGLASLLLGQKDGGGQAFQGFLAGQGVQLGQAEDDDEEHEGADEDENDRGGSHAQSAQSTATPKAKPSASRTTSASATTPNHKTSTNRGKSKRTSAPTTTEATVPNHTSPIVVPSPPPVAMKSSRKRRAPSLDEPALPQPEAPVNHAKPAAKRRRAPQSGSQEDESDTTVSSVPAAARRTTRSAAAGKGRS